jgi:hypothetical protein
VESKGKVDSQQTNTKLSDCTANMRFEISFIILIFIENLIWSFKELMKVFVNFSTDNRTHRLMNRRIVLNMKQRINPVFLATFTQLFTEKVRSFSRLIEMIKRSQNQQRNYWSCSHVTKQEVSEKIGWSSEVKEKFLLVLNQQSFQNSSWKFQRISIWQKFWQILTN